MTVRGMSTERLLGVTARLLASAAVLVVVGLGMVVRLMWQQLGQTLGPDGTPSDAGMDLASRVTIMVFETGYRPVGVQLLLASVLLAAAVGFLHAGAATSLSRSIRWEVLGAGVVVLVAVVGVVLAHLYVVTADDAVTARANGYIGPQPMTELVLGNLSVCAASLALLAGAALWWMRSGQAPDDAVEEPAGEDATSEDAISEDGTVEDADPGEVPRGASRVRDDSMDGAPVDYSRDWSPEDFRPPT